MTMKRINIDRLQRGDIVLTASQTKLAKTIRASTGGLVSHAMICVGHSSIIDSTAVGVHARNLQRELFGVDEQVFAFRTREPLSEARLMQVVDFARSQVGTRYSKIEAARSVIGGPKPRNNQQFCSRLVARAYASIDMLLVADKDYCTPEDLRVSPFLRELGDITEIVSDTELAAWEKRLDPISAMQNSQNAVLDAGRRRDPSIENFADLDRLVREHPEWDAEIAQACRDSGYLDIWRNDFEVNPWHYDVEQMDIAFSLMPDDGVRRYCVSTIQEAYSGGLRFAVNLYFYRTALQAARRETTALLVELYE